jgi:hypothetical protein
MFLTCISELHQIRAALLNCGIKSEFGQKALSATLLVNEADAPLS